MAEPPTLFADRYELREQLGKGGMGSVWEARDERLDRVVAIKLMAAELRFRATSMARFEQEARAMAKLASPHIVLVHDFGIEPRPFIVMERLRGEDLAAILAREGALAPARVGRIVAQTCRALATAHDAGIMHRDLKPENLFICGSGDGEHVKVVDFGVARALEPDQREPLTQEGSPVGTPQYMSPEQLDSKEDHRDDLWSVAVIAYVALTGIHPFGGESLITLFRRVLVVDWDPIISHRPRMFALDPFFQRAFAVERDERFQTADELAAAFVSAVEALPASSGGGLAPDAAKPTTTPTSVLVPGPALTPTAVITPTELAPPTERLAGPGFGVPTPTSVLGPDRSSSVPPPPAPSRVPSGDTVPLSDLPVGIRSPTPSPSTRTPPPADPTPARAGAVVAFGAVVVAVMLGGTVWLLQGSSSPAPVEPGASASDPIAHGEATDEPVAEPPEPEEEEEATVLPSAEASSEATAPEPTASATAAVAAPPTPRPRPRPVPRPTQPRPKPATGDDLFKDGPF